MEGENTYINDTYQKLLDIQYANGHFTYDDLSEELQNTIHDKYRGKKLCLNRRDLQIYYTGRTRSGLTANFLCEPKS
jgi:hypothetical protein